MFFADYHLHTGNSPDSEALMTDMALASLRRGMNEICFTDHVDLDYETGKYNPNHFSNRAGIFTDYKNTLKDMDKKIEIRIGIELGEGNHYPEKARELYATPGLDFVIGSLHNLRNTTDFYYMKYESEEQCSGLNRIYLAEYTELASQCSYDVIGHIGYTRRYMTKAGFEGSLTQYWDEIKALLQTVIDSGRGIEVNTSGLRSFPGEFIPSPWIIKAYKDLGGEIITVGSDAHKPEDASMGIRDAYELIRQCGFRYITVFRNHKPEFIKI